MNYETMQHLNRERLDRRLHEATNERLAHSDTGGRHRDSSAWVAALRSKLHRPVPHTVGGATPQPQL